MQEAENCRNLSGKRKHKALYVRRYIPFGKYYFTDLHFPEKVEQDDPLYEKAYFKVADVDDYEAVKEAIKKTDIDWRRYDLIDNNGNLDTMASNFNDLEKISNTLLIVVTAASSQFCF